MNAIVFGASGGLGTALVELLLSKNKFDRVFAISRSRHTIPGAVNLVVDPIDEDGLTKLEAEIVEHGPLTLCIVAIGILSDGQKLQPERSYQQQSVENFEKVFRANTIAPALIAKHMLPVMPRDRPVTFAALSARVGSISDNQLGGWHAYRASKAALNMLVKNYALEQVRRNAEAVIVGLHPGTVDTQLSKPFQKNLPKGQLFSPSQSAAYLMDVITRLTPNDSGKIFDWAGNEIPA